MTDSTDKVFEGDHLRVGDHVWINSGLVHPDKRLRGIIVKITPSDWGTPDFHTAFAWPDETRTDTWEIPGEHLTRIGVIERLAETAEVSEILKQLKAALEQADA